MEGSSGSSNEGSTSTVSNVGLPGVTSCNNVGNQQHRELELGLGLGLGLKPWTYCTILTAKDLPSLVSSSSAATHRTANYTDHDLCSNFTSNQVVGWPPIRAYRMNSFVNQSKVPSEQNNTVGNLKNNEAREKGHRHSKYVKVNMDGVAIGRKVDLNAHVCYETLAQALEDMFQSPTSMNNTTRPTGFQDHEGDAAKSSKLLDGSSELVLTYEDREGDWLLVGDVPWEMFLNSARRLRIMKTSEANGLAPRFQDKRHKQRCNPF